MIKKKKDISLPSIFQEEGKDTISHYFCSIEKPQRIHKKTLQFTRANKYIQQSYRIQD